MRYAIIENELVINIIVADKDFIDNHYPDAVECDDAINIGHIYKDGDFIAPPPNIAVNETLAE